MSSAKRACVVLSTLLLPFIVPSWCEAPLAEEAPPADAEKYIIEADLTEGYELEGEQILVATGNVKITHGSTTITCNKVTSFEKERMALLEGNVVVDDVDGGYRLLAGYVEYYRKERHSIASKEPVLYLTKREDKPIRVESIFMEMFSKEDRGIASGNVWIYQEDITAQGDQCVYLGKEDKIILTGDPVAWQKDNKLGGEVITLYLVDDVVEKLLVEGDSRLIFFSHKGSEKEESPEEVPEGGGGEGSEHEVAEGEGEEAGEESAEDVDSFVPALGYREIAPLADEDGGEKYDNEEYDNIGEESPLDVVGEEGESEGGELEGGVDDEERPISGRVETYGETTTAFLVDEKVERVLIEGQAQGIYYPYDELTEEETGESVFVQGKLIDVAVEDDTIKSIRVLGDAVGIYDPGPTEQGSTKAYGRTIVVYMEEGDIDRIIVRGDAKGIYLEEKAGVEEGESEGGGTGITSGGSSQ